MGETGPSFWNIYFCPHHLYCRNLSQQDDAYRVVLDISDISWFDPCNASTYLFINLRSSRLDGGKGYVENGAEEAYEALDWALLHTMPCSRNLLLSGLVVVLQHEYRNNI
jgi:hypothetical protein